jgi:RHS repeat-associated protein
LNHFAALVNQAVVLTTSNKPATKAVPSNTDYESLAQAQFAEAINDYYDREIGISDREDEATLTMVLMGETAIVGEWDATVGLYHFRARWMSGLTGRFLTRDPIGFAGSPFSLYEFLDSRGTSTTDPTGKQCCMHIWLPRGIFEVGHSALKCGSSYYSFWPSTGAGPLSPTDACSGNTEAGDEASEGRPADQKVCLDTCQLDEGAIAAKWNEMMQECRSGARTYCMYGANCATSVAGLINAGLVPGCDKCNPCQIFKGCTTPCDGSFRGGIPGIDDPVSLESYGKCLKKNGCKKSPICHDTPDGSVGSF